MAKKLLTTPRGVAVYPHLTKPDTKFNAAGEYKIKWQGEADELVKKIDAAMAESLKATREAIIKDGKKFKVKMADPPYTKNDDGTVTLSFKMVASGVSKKTKEPWTRRPVLFDAAGKPYVTLPKVGGGSEVKVSFELNQYSRQSTETKGLMLAGANLRLEAVQILKLVEWGANAAYFGFEPEEGDLAEDAVSADEIPAGISDEAEVAAEGESGDDF